MRQWNAVISFLQMEKKMQERDKKETEHRSAELKPFVWTSRLAFPFTRKLCGDSEKSTELKWVTEVEYLRVVLSIYVADLIFKRLCAVQFKLIQFFHWMTQNFQGFDQI